MSLVESVDLAAGIEMSQSTWLRCPGAQAQVLRHQQPHAQVRAADFIGQSLPHPTLQAYRVALRLTGVLPPREDLQRFGQTWPALRKFFVAAHRRR